MSKNMLRTQISLECIFKLTKGKQICFYIKTCHFKGWRKEKRMGNKWLEGRRRDWLKAKRLAVHHELKQWRLV